MQQEANRNGYEKETNRRMIIPAFLIALVLGFFLPIHNHHPEFQGYVKEYLAIVQKVCQLEQLNYPARTTILFSKTFTDKNEAAQCETFDDGQWEIRVLEPYWNKITPDNKRTIIFHELSHCILLQDHVADPMNYMYPSLIDVEQDIINDQVLGDAWNHCGLK